MRETQVERVPTDRPQTYRTNVGATSLELGRRVETLTADVNRLLGDIAIRLQRLEERLTALEKE